MAPADSRPPGCTRRNWPGQARLSSGGASVHRTDINQPGGHDILGRFPFTFVHGIHSKTFILSHFPSRQVSPLGLKMLCLIAFSEPPSESTWLENALKVADAALLVPIATAGWFGPFGAANFLRLGGWRLGRRRRLFLVFFDLGFILHDKWP